jgi:hypothetical protein
LDMTYDKLRMRLNKYFSWLIYLYSFIIVETITKSTILNVLFKSFQRRPCFG